MLICRKFGTCHNDFNRWRLLWKNIERLKETFPGDVNWNFDALFLVGQEGVPVGRYSPRQLKNADADLQYLVTQGGF